MATPSRFTEGRTKVAGANAGAEPYIDPWLGTLSFAPENGDAAFSWCGAAAGLLCKTKTPSTVVAYSILLVCIATLILIPDLFRPWCSVPCYGWFSSVPGRSLIRELAFDRPASRRLDREREWEARQGLYFSGP